MSPITYCGDMLDPVLLVVYALAVASVTGLITSDTITEDLRDRFIGWLDDRPRTLGSYTAKLVTCPWCASMWISAAAAPTVWFWGDRPWLVIPGLAFAFRQVAGMTSQIGR
jgi:Protein of unknown function (DUF1360)